MHSESESEFGRVLAGIEERTGLSHQRIAEAAGVDRSQVWRWIKSGSTPGYEPVRRLTAWLIAERPEVADAAGLLLPAAGYDTPPHVTVRAGVDPPGGELAPTGIPVIDNAASPEDVAPFVWQIENEVERAEREHGPQPTGEQIFGPGQEADSWDYLAARPEVKIRLIATIRLIAFKARSSESGDTRTGLRVLPGGA